MWYVRLMPTVTIRLSEAEREALDRQAAARGVSVSEVVRESLRIRGADLEGRVDDLDSRVSDLERMVNA